MQNTKLYFPSNVSTAGSLKNVTRAPNKEVRLYLRLCLACQKLWAEKTRVWRNADKLLLPKEATGAGRRQYADDARCKAVC